MVQRLNWPGRKRIPAPPRCLPGGTRWSGAAHLIQAVERIAPEHAPTAVATVGLLEVTPGSRNVVPGAAFLTIDVRDPSDASLDAIEAKLHAAATSLNEERRLSVNMQRVWKSPPVVFDSECVDIVARGAERAGYSFPQDDVWSRTRRRLCRAHAPTAMIFVPCAGGLSHNEEEATTYDQCAAGAQVLLQHRPRNGPTDGCIICRRQFAYLQGHAATSASTVTYWRSNACASPERPYASKWRMGCTCGCLEGENECRR